MRAVAFEWLKRGPATALTPAFIRHFNAKDLDDLVEGVYLQRYQFDRSVVMLAFEVARQGDPQALEVMHWAGRELGEIGVGVINQLGLQQEEFDVVLIGSLYDGHPLLVESLRETIFRTAPGANLVRLTVPPVVGGVLLGMEQTGLNGVAVRDRLTCTTKKLIEKE
jgi:N-acetylglucosamine kinase-like BadF-type ATPase